ncbi:regulator of volume decrease after cellular swelling-domain-containing protein [Pisolithus croceorrhizus]|nr:regulator of volume decrease after cellular swelling-domain-containing protein [Pisolithus croceorrhizus]KAI6168214.1 regulator of volume decrease after cellular swelling-domain-containing protein [Pisolithus thermaeus]
MVSATIITSVPLSVSPEQHREIVGATPGSFNDIPPVLRHREDDVSITFEPTLEEFTAEDGRGGTLYVIESALVFMSTTGRGFQVPYPAITLHAVSRPQGSSPSIYCQLDEGTNDTGDDVENVDMRELTITPKDPASLDPIFEALSFCASLHPDPDIPEDEDDDAFITDGRFETFTGGDEEELSEVGRVRSDFVNDHRYAPY